MKPGALIAKKFRLTRRIGEGAMGEVWAATNELTGGEVALKFILKQTKDLRLRLLREARAAGGIKHPNVLEIHDVGETDEGEPFLVMPLLTGETLGELLSRTRRLEVPVAARIGRDVARALAAAHAKQIIHRDLKPANIFLQQLPDTDEPVVKVLDFGVSKNLEGSDGLSTTTGGIMGSPAYMSPEQARADRSIDPRADLWSLGVVLFEMLTGVRPFEGDSNQLLVKITTTEAPRVSRSLWQVDPALDALVARCLERDRDRRIGLATDLARELDRFTGTGAPASALSQSSQNQVSPFAASAARPPMGSRPELDPAARSPRLEGLLSVASPADDEDGLAATAPLDPRRLAAAMAFPQPAPAAHPDLAPMSQQKYAVTAPLSAFGPGSGGLQQAAPVGATPQFGGSAHGSGQYARMGSAHDLNAPSRALPGGAPATGQRPGALGGTVPIQPPMPPDATRGGEMALGPLQSPTAQPGAGASTGYGTEGNSASLRVGAGGTVKLPAPTPEIIAAARAASMAASPTSSTSALVKTPTVDPGLSSDAGALRRRRRALIGVISGLSVMAVGLIGVMLYQVLAPHAPTAPASAGNSAATTSPAPSIATASAAATAMATAAPTAVDTPAPQETQTPAAPVSIAAPPTTAATHAPPAPTPARTTGSAPRPTNAPTAPKSTSAVRVPSFISGSAGKK